MSESVSSSSHAPLPVLHIHPPLLKGVIEIYRSVFREGRRAERAVPAALKMNAKWGAKDRRFVAEIAYDGVRWRRLFWHLAGKEEAFDDASLTAFIGAQLVWMKKAGAVTGVQMPLVPATILEDRYASASPAIKVSVPDWFYDYGAATAGPEWEADLAASNGPAAVHLRINRRRAKPDQVTASLRNEGFTILPGPFKTWTAEGKGSLMATEAFKNGWFEIQDAGSQQIAPFLQAGEGMHILDACAGAGGKSLHLFDLVGPKAQYLALDTDSTKLDELRSRAGRAGADRIRTSLINSPELLARYAGWADRLLLDVPCSGSGVLRRNPDTKWKLTEKDIDKLLFQQSHILQTYTAMLKPGGLCVYATCSLFRSENEDRVQAFLAANPSFELVAEQRIHPTEGCDGFYMARIRKNS